jgi:hypothetical protein
MTDYTRTIEKNLQFHFVVRWDEASRAWSVDAETLDAKFDTEVIWDEDSNTWISYKEDDNLRSSFLDKEDALAILLQDFNDRLHEEEK